MVLMMMLIVTDVNAHIGHNVKYIYKCERCFITARGVSIKVTLFRIGSCSVH